MTQTTNLGLKKIDGGDNWRQIFDDHNQSMELIDGAVAKSYSNLAYVEDGDTASRNYSVGEFLTWKGVLHSVTAAIAQGESFVLGTNVQDESSRGGLNALKTLTITGHTPAGVGLATWNTSGLVLTNRIFIAMLIQIDSSWHYVSQGTDGLSVGIDKSTRAPFIYLPSQAAAWMDKDCLAVYI